MTIHDFGSYFRIAMGRKRFVLAIDTACALVAMALLLIVVLNGRDVWPVVTLLGVTAVASAAAMYMFRTYRQLWSRVTLNDVVDLAKAALVVSLATAFASYWDFGPHAPIRVGTGSFFGCGGKVRRPTMPGRSSVNLSPFFCWALIAVLACSSNRTRSIRGITLSASSMRTPA
jgi:hypothetical protein